MMFDFMTTLSRGFHSSKVMYLVFDLEQVSLWFLLCALSFCFAEKDIKYQIRDSGVLTRKEECHKGPLISQVL